MTEEVTSLSIVLVAYNMQRELPRTLYTLSNSYQDDIDGLELDIVVVDNGSKVAISEAEVKAANPLATVTKPEIIDVSPVGALNDAIFRSRGEVVCAFIDAARMASPGLLSTAMTAINTDERAVVGTLSFHLGQVPQNDSVHQGYNQQVEDQLLSTVDWRQDGYKLFDISSLDPSSRLGLFTCPAETNSLFMRRAMWEEYGAFEPRFKTKGGGIANLDLWRRVCADPRNKIILLVGEGTFHQFHGGAATNATVSPWEEFDQEYASIRGANFEFLTFKSTMHGVANLPWQAFLARRVLAERWNPTMTERVLVHLKKALGR